MSKCIQSLDWLKTNMEIKKKDTTFILIAKYMSKKYYRTLKKFFLFFELLFIFIYSFINSTLLISTFFMHTTVFDHAIVSFKRLYV